MEELPKVNSVRAIIDLFEENSKSETAQRLNKSLSKSFSGLSFSERKAKSYFSNGHDIFPNLEQRLMSISFKLNQYRVYAKDIHIALQEELLEIMTTLLNVDVKNNTFMYKMRELLVDIRGLFKNLNGKLPGSSSTMRGFGDYTYKPFSWNRNNSIGSAIVEPTSPLPPRKRDPQRAQSVVEDYVNSLQQGSYKLGGSNREFQASSKADEESLKSNDDSLLSPSSFKRTPNFIIGGAVGTRHTLNPEDSVWKDRTGDNVQFRSRTIQRSSSEITPDDNQEKPVITSWRDSSKPWSYADQLRGRRRPVSLGGTVVTLNSAEDIISSMKLSRDFPQTPDLVNQENEEKGQTDNPEDDSLQSVNLLKRFFELKLIEREKRQQQKSFNAKEDQREEFQEYVEQIEKSIQAEGEQQNTSSSVAEENADDSSNETIVAVEGEVQQCLSRSTSVQADETEGLNTPVLRGQNEVDEVVVTSTNEEIEEGDSLCSEQSIYLDPVD